MDALIRELKKKDKDYRFEIRDPKPVLVLIEMLKDENSEVR